MSKNALFQQQKYKDYTASGIASGAASRRQGVFRPDGKDVRFRGEQKRRPSTAAAHHRVPEVDYESGSYYKQFYRQVHTARKLAAKKRLPEFEFECVPGFERVVI